MEDSGEDCLPSSSRSAKNAGQRLSGISFCIMLLLNFSREKLIMMRLFACVTLRQLKVH